MSRSETFGSRWRASWVALCLAFLSPVFVANQLTPTGQAGPEDDPGTLPTTTSSGSTAPPTLPEDDPGTLPSTKEDLPGPTITFTGPATLVSSMLPVGGNVSTQPGPFPGELTAHLKGAQLLVLHLDDPRLSQVRVQLNTGSVFQVGQIRIGSLASSSFLMAPGTDLGIPVQNVLQRADLIGQPIKTLLCF